jgi:hypothetical protein
MDVVESGLAVIGIRIWRYAITRLIRHTRVLRYKIY